jgi:hypothetical protein
MPLTPFCPPRLLHAPRQTLSPRRCPENVENASCESPPPSWLPASSLFPALPSSFPFPYAKLLFSNVWRQLSISHSSCILQSHNQRSRHDCAAAWTCVGTVWLLARNLKNSSETSSTSSLRLSRCILTFRFVRKNRGWFPAPAVWQVSDRARVRGLGMFGSHRLFSW